MGLDIRVATSILEITDKDRIVEGDYYLHVLHDHPEMERASDIKEGYYDLTGESFSFRAGSYSGYNFFRNLLSEAILGVPAKMVWERTEFYEKKPFFELINFSDCEGCMGPEVSKKLYNDFEENKEKFYTFVKNKYQFESQFYTRVYDDFMTGYGMVGDEGVLIFS